MNPPCRSRLLRVRLLAALCVVSATTGARAGSGFWTNITPIGNGFVVGFAVDPAVPTTLYAIAAGGENGLSLVRSDDDGGSWIDLGLPRVESFAINPVSTATIY